jgi:hypothetical protein
MGVNKSLPIWYGPCSDAPCSWFRLQRSSDKKGVTKISISTAMADFIEKENNALYQTWSYSNSHGFVNRNTGQVYVRESANETKKIPPYLSIAVVSALLLNMDDHKGDEIPGLKPKEMKEYIRSLTKGCAFFVVDSETEQDCHNKVPQHGMTANQLASAILKVHTETPYHVIQYAKGCFLFTAFDENIQTYICESRDDIAQQREHIIPKKIYRLPCFCTEEQKHEPSTFGFWVSQYQIG